MGQLLLKIQCVARIVTLALSVCFVLLAWPRTSYAESSLENKILWMHPDFPPIYILDVPYAGEGVGDKVLAFFEQRLPQYQHYKLTANFKRIISTISSGEQACGITLLKNQERAKTVLFSQVLLLAPQNEVIVLKNRMAEFLPLMDEAGTVSLRDLLTKSHLIMGYSVGRSYSSNVDEVVNSLANEVNSYATYGRGIFTGLINMLKRKRIDYTIGYGYEARYLAGQLNFDEEVVAIPVREHLDYIPVYAGCPKTPWGEKVIDDLNTIIISSRNDPDLYAVYKPWLDPQSWARYRDAWAHFVETLPTKSD